MAMQGRATIAASLAFVLVLASAPAGAISTISFDDAVPGGGTILYGGLGGPLTGFGIPYDQIRSNGETPLNPNAVLTCNLCQADWTTGDNTQEGAINGGAWTFAGTLGFQLFGEVPELGIPIFSSLVTGSVTSGAFTAIDDGNGVSWTDAVLGSVQLHPTLAAFFGLDTPVVPTLRARPTEIRAALAERRAASASSSIGRVSTGWYPRSLSSLTRCSPACPRAVFRPHRGRSRLP